MIMGADVTHPSPDSQGIPSVAAVTASHDPKAFCYNICWRLQPPKVEIIEDLEQITREHLEYFYQATKLKPERIVFFRDGVSEGQFDQVKRVEIMAIRKACKNLQASDYEPSITFLVVQKRHHTRMFPLNPRDSEDNNNNVPAGMIFKKHQTFELKLIIIYWYEKNLRSLGIYFERTAHYLLFNVCSIVRYYIFPVFSQWTLSEQT